MSMTVLCGFSRPVYYKEWKRSNWGHMQLDPEKCGTLPSTQFYTVHIYIVLENNRRFDAAQVFLLHVYRKNSSTFKWTYRRCRGLLVGDLAYDLRNYPYRGLKTLWLTI